MSQNQGMDTMNQNMDEMPLPAQSNQSKCVIFAVDFAMVYQIVHQMVYYLVNALWYLESQEELSRFGWVQ